MRAVLVLPSWLFSLIFGACDAVEWRAKWVGGKNGPRIERAINRRNL